MDVKIKKGKTKDIERMLQHFRKITSSNIKIGYFQEQGKHSTGDYYTTIMRIHEDGLGDNPSRPGLAIGSFELETGSSDDFNASVRRAITDVGKAGKNINDVAEAARDHIQSIFGDPVKLAPVTSNPTPLEDTGELKENLTYKVE